MIKLMTDTCRVQDHAKDSQDRTISAMFSEVDALALAIVIVIVIESESGKENENETTIRGPIDEVNAMMTDPGQSGDLLARMHNGTRGCDELA